MGAPPFARTTSHGRRRRGRFRTPDPPAALLLETIPQQDPCSTHWGKMSLVFCLLVHCTTVCTSPGKQLSHQGTYNQPDQRRRYETHGCIACVPHIRPALATALLPLPTSTIYLLRMEDTWPFSFIDNTTSWTIATHWNGSASRIVITRAGRDDTVKRSDGTTLSEETPAGDH